MHVFVYLCVLGLTVSANSLACESKSWHSANYSCLICRMTVCICFSSICLNTFFVPKVVLIVKQTVTS